MPPARLAASCCWQETDDNQNPYAGTSQGVDGAFLGGPCDDYAQLVGFWEYIRRFMEEGPQAAPRPRRLRTRWPNPVSSLLTVFRLNLPGGIGKLPFFRVLRVIMFPAFFIWMLGHQLSQLLSYEGVSQGHPPRQRESNWARCWR